MNSATAPVAAHLPELMVVRWERTKRELRGLERELARRHLHRCESCRRELRERGFDPELEIVPELEASPEVLQRLKGEPGVRKIRPAPRDWLWWVRERTQWVLEGYAVAATAVLLVLLAGPMHLPGMRGSDETIRPPSMSAGGRGESSLSRVEPLEVRSARRAAEPADQVVELAPGARFVPLQGDPLGIPDSSTVELVIRAEDGRTRARINIAYSDLRSGKVFFEQSGAPLEEGTYVVYVRALHVPEPAEATTTFTLRRGAQH
ncbi:MAG: hypothetical protein ACRD1B_06125 [Thermoanaerobaculia bacterium]